MREMLDVRSHSVRIDTLYRALGWFFLFIPLAYLVHFHRVAEVMLVVTSSLAFLILGVAIWVARKGKRAAVIFLVAFSALIISSVIGSLWGLNILPTHFITVYGFQIGSAVEMILLALALADRVNDSRKAHFAAQAQVLLAERQRVEALQESERALEARVSQRTAELSDSLEKLKLAQEELVQAERLPHWVRWWPGSRMS